MLECEGWRGWQRSCRHGSGWLPPLQGWEGLGWDHHRCLPPPRVEKVVLGKSHGVTVEGLAKGMRTRGIGKK